MTPAEMAALHRAAFTQERPWSEAEFANLLTNRHVAAFTAPHGFALTRTVAGESELLTLAVDPTHHRKGIGRCLTEKWLDAIAQTAEVAFLEVAADNTAAHTLYLSIGFTEITRRPAYYARKNAAPADAILMQRDLTLGRAADSAT